MLWFDTKASSDRSAAVPGFQAGAFLFAFVATAILSIEFTRFSGNVAALWPANGVLCAALFRLDRHWDSAAFLGLAVAFNACINLMFEQPLGVSVAMGGLNALDALIAFLLIDRFCRGVFRLDDTKLLLRFSVIAVVAPVLPALLAAFVLSQQYGSGFIENFRIWHIGDALGLALVVPAIKLWLNRNQHHDTGRPATHVMAFFALLVATQIVIFGQTKFPLLFLLLPVLTLIAFQLGPVWTAFATLLSSIVAFGFTAHGLGPAALIPRADIIERVQFVQFFITIIFLTSLPAAYTLARQAQLRERLVESEKNLRLAKDRAERALSAKSEFLATMSHEIRTPLNSIVGYSELGLRREELTPELRSDLSIIRDASVSLHAIVNDILDFSSIEAGQHKLTPAPFRLGDLVEKCRGLTEVIAQQKGIALSVAVSDELRGYWIDADELRLRQILLNLLNNAIKYTEEGEVACSIMSITESSTTATLRFSVSDTGIGITRAGQKELFKRFTQLETGRRRRFGGAGLGLAISDRLVRQMGGRIIVQSAPGLGSTFWFELELSRCEPSHAASVNAGPPRDRLLPLHVLVVDDLKPTRDLTRAILVQFGHRVSGAASGPEAIDLTKTEAFDMILMDVQMPGMDGLTATRLIRQLGERHRDVPIIAMTANVLSEEIELCIQAGMDDHIGKPFVWNDLLAKMDKLSRRRMTVTNGTSL